MPKPERKYICIPAVRLSDGTFLKGQPHTLLFLRALESGYTGPLVSGFLDAKDRFTAMDPEPEYFFPFRIVTREYGIELASNGSYQGKWAAEALIEAGRDDQEGLKAYVEKFDSLKKLAIVPAIEAQKSGKVYYGARMHGELKAQHPELSKPRPLGDDSYILGGFNTGWFDLDRKVFITFGQAAAYSESVTGYCTNIRRLVSGEEFITRIETPREAEDLGRNWHKHGYSHAKSRINVFKTRDINHKHIELLEIAIGEYENAKR